MKGRRSGRCLRARLKAVPKIRSRRKDDEPIDWAGVEDAYASRETLKQIAARFGVGLSTLSRVAKEQGWTRPKRVAATVKVKSAKVKSAKVTSARPRTGRAKTAAGADRATPKRTRSAIVARLFQALDEKMKHLEQRIALGRDEGASQSAADGERDARTLSALARLYAKLVELDDKAQGETAGRKSGAKRTDDDADRLRRDLARRLERLNQAQDA